MLSVCSQRIRIIGWLFSVLGVLFAGAARVDAQVPKPWITKDVGRPALTGTATYDNGVFTVSAGGTGIANYTDQFTFIHRKLTGDSTIVARVDALTPAAAGSTVGLMFRTDLTKSAAHGYVYLAADGTVGFYRRAEAGGRSIVRVASGARSAPVWLALKREANVLTAYVSTDGRSWQRVGAGTVALTDAVHVGIATAAQSPSLHTMADVSNVGFSMGSSTALPHGQIGIDIGQPTPTGSSRESDGVYTITAGGANIGGTADQFHFVYREITGDIDIKARVNSLLAVDPATKAGVMIRGSLSPSAPYAYTVITGGAGYGFERRPTAGGSSAATPAGSGVAPGWVRLVRRGQRIESYRSADGQSWTLIESLDISLPSVVYVGLAVTSHNPAVATSASIRNLTVDPPAPPPNGVPTVSLTAPASGATAVAPGSFTLAATASDPEGRLSRVDFLADGSVIGSDPSAPFGITWGAVAAGTYAVTARVYDQDGASAVSANTIAVTVTATAPNAPPTVGLTSPTAGQTFAPPATITVSASASDPEGRLDRVEFHVNGSSIGQDTTSPYSVPWSAVPAGSYRITAVAVDAAGLRTESSAVDITVRVTTANLAPVVSLTSPTNGQAFGTGSNILLTANAADPEGRLARVEFYRGTALIGTDTSSPFSAMWSGAATGTHTLSAVAWDVEGMRADSAPVSITVSTGGVVPTNGSWTVVFTAPADHALNVTSYQLNVYAQGANPATALPVATSDLGKPTPDGSSGISVDRTPFINALNAGTYSATVTAIGPGGSTQSQPIAFTR